MPGKSLQLSLGPKAVEQLDELSDALGTKSHGDAIRVSVQVARELTQRRLGVTGVRRWLFTPVIHPRWYMLCLAMMLVANGAIFGWLISWATQ